MKRAVPICSLAVALGPGSCTTARADGDRIGGFRLSACFPGSCIKLESTEARRSPIDGNFAFRDARFEVWPKAGRRPTRTWAVLSGTYDPESGDLILRGNPNAYVDLVGQTLNLQP